MGLVGRLRTVFNDRVLTAPSPFFTPQFAQSDDRSVDAAVAQIHETAALDAGALFSRDTCAAISAEMDRAFVGARPDARSSVNAKTGIGHVAGPLRLHPALLEFATHPFLLGIVERYLRRRIFLADIDMRRVPPMTMDELNERAGTRSVGYTSSHWHRDIRGRQAKIMIYLTDVGEKDSNFAYIPRTHAGHQVRPLRMEDSRLSDDAVAALGVPPVECYGPAGTTLVFDTNLVHRLRRKTGATVRDSVTYYYTPGQELRALDIDPAALERLPQESRALFGGSRVAY